MTHFNPYLEKSEIAFWRSAVAEKSGLIDKNLFQKKFEINKTTKIATAGSCFAQHIGRTLRLAGYNILDYEPAPKYLPNNIYSKYNYETYSARYGNIYTSAQLLQIAKEAFGLIKLSDYAEQTSAGKFIDYLRPGVEPFGFDLPQDVYTHRKFHLDAVKRLLLDMDVFVFTFGLTEGWENTKHDYVYPVSPGTIAGSFDDRIHRFINYDYDEILTHFLEFKCLINNMRSKECKFILTVSPVPLTATYTDDHVMVATMASKSILRAVTAKLTKQFDDIVYFPSYEIIVNPWIAGINYEENLRSVKPDAVSQVMKIFMESISDSSDLNEGESKNNNSVMINSDIDVLICEESILEAFRPSSGGVK